MLSTLGNNIASGYWSMEEASHSDQEEKSEHSGIEAPDTDDGDEDEEVEEGLEDDLGEEEEELEEDDGEEGQEEGSVEEDEGEEGQEDFSDEEEQEENRGTEPTRQTKRERNTPSKTPAAASPPLEFQRFALKKTGNKPQGDLPQSDQPSPKSTSDNPNEAPRLEFQKFALKKTGIVPAVELRPRAATASENPEPPAWLANLKKTPRGISASPPAAAAEKEASEAGGSNPTAVPPSWRKTPRSEDPANPPLNATNAVSQPPPQPSWMANLRKGATVSQANSTVGGSEGGNIPPWKKNVSSMAKPGDPPKPAPNTVATSPIVSPSRWAPGPSAATSPGWQPLSPQPQGPWHGSQQTLVGGMSPAAQPVSAPQCTASQVVEPTSKPPDKSESDHEGDNSQPEADALSSGVTVSGTEDMAPFQPMDARNAYKYGRALAVLKVKLEQEQRLRKGAQQRLQWAHKALARAVRDLEKARERLEGLEQHLSEERSEALINRIKEMELALVGEFGQDALSSDSDLEVQDVADKAGRGKTKHLKANPQKTRKNEVKAHPDEKRSTKSAEKPRSSKSSTKHKDKEKRSSRSSRKKES